LLEKPGCSHERFDDVRIDFAVQSVEVFLQILEKEKKNNKSIKQVDRCWSTSVNYKVNNHPTCPVNVVVLLPDCIKNLRGTVSLIPAEKKQTNNKRNHPISDNKPNLVTLFPDFLGGWVTSGFFG
jgi:hypothetical protein